MNKLFTLTALGLLLSLSANAQKIRKTWDFREGFSNTTVANLYADMEQNGTAAHWRNWEKNEADAGKYGDTFWCADGGSTVNSNNEAVTIVNGEEIPIPELSGLDMKGIKAKGLILASNYPTAENADSPNGIYPYGGGFIWLNGKNLTFKIKQAQKGETLRIGVESHKNTEARGINVIVNGETLTPTEGEQTPKFFNEVVYNIPDDTPDVDDYTEVTIKSTHGCHIYYMIIGAGDDPNANKTKIGYLYGGNKDAENALNLIAGNEKYIITPIDVTGNISEVTADSLQGFDVTIASSTVATDNAIVNVLKEALPWTPVLNLNPALYAAWGYGEATATDGFFGVTNNEKSDLYKGMTLIPGSEAGLEEGMSGIVFTNGAANVTGVKLGEYFANDEILATDPAGATTLIHAHNILHNGYLYLPLTQEVLADANQEGDATTTMLANAIGMLKESKSNISKVPAPTFALEYKNLNTNVTIKNSNKAAKIFYTTDGTEPTTGSTAYEGTFNLDKETTVKAVAIAEGYKLSDVAEVLVEMKHQAVTPVISAAIEDGKTTVTISCETPDVDIWYNYSASTDSTKSTKYTEPVVLTDGKTMSAFAIGNEYVQSELATEEILIRNAKLRIDAIAHMDANPDEYNGGATTTKYYFSWGKDKNKYPYYDESIYEIVTGSDGQDSIVYTTLNPQETVYFGNGWKVVSRGHVMIWENIKPGSDIGVLGAYNPASVEDYDTLVTNYYINIGEWNTNYPRNGEIATSVKHAGPFDVVSFISNGNSGGSPKIVFEVSADSTEWKQIGDTCVLGAQRMYKKFTRSYEGTDEVYVRTRIADGNSKAGFYDIYIMNHGEKSIARENQLATGIEDINAETPSSKATPAAIYTINGTRVSTLQRGINIVKMSDGTAKKVIIR